MSTPELLADQAHQLDTQHHWTQAAQIYLQAANQETNPNKKSLFQAFSAQMLINSGQVAQALDRLQDTAQQAKNDQLTSETHTRINYHVGWAYYDSGQYPQARQTFQTALSLAETPDLKSAIEHHLARVDLDEGILSSNPQQLTNAYQQLSNHNQQLGGEVAHDLRLMARAQQCLTLINQSTQSQQLADQLYEQSTIIFKNQGDPYYPYLLPAERQLLQETKQPQVAIQFQNYLRPRREQLITELEQAPEPQRPSIINKLVEDFKQTLQ